MNKTKEEIIIREQISNAIDNGRTAFKNWKSFNPSVEGMYSEDKFIIDKLESCLTDQIKSMEGQVKELRDENEIQGNYNDMLIKELESLQKENERLYDALSNIMNNERWLEMNIDTVNNLISKHA